MVRTLTPQAPGEIYRRKDKKNLFCPCAVLRRLTPLRRSENGNSKFVDLQEQMHVN